MKNLFPTVLALALFASAAQAQPPAVETNTPAKPDFSKVFSSDKQKFSYAIGMNAASSLKGQLKKFDMEIDIDEATKAFKDVLSGTNALIAEDQLRGVFEDLNKQIRAKMQEKAEKGKKAGEEFLAKNKANAGVTTLPDGLQYKVITDGTGPMPKATDEVTVNYRGTLVDGTEFDSSAKTGKPFTTRVSGSVIKGWTEALQLMKTGSKWQIYVPADLAYGPTQRGPLITPNSVLIFDLELLSTQTAPTPPAPPAGPGAMMRPPSAPLTSDIIKVPSAEEIKKGAKIETIKAEDLEKARTNSAPQ